MSNKKNKIDVFAEAALSACNAYIESVFSENGYDNLTAKEKIRLNMVLINTKKLELRYKA